MAYDALGPILGQQLNLLVQARGESVIVQLKEGDPALAEEVAEMVKGALDLQACAKTLLEDHPVAKAMMK